MEEKRGGKKIQSLKNTIQYTHTQTDSRRNAPDGTDRLTERQACRPSSGQIFKQTDGQGADRRVNRQIGV